MNQATIPLTTLNGRIAHALVSAQEVLAQPSAPGSRLYWTQLRVDVPIRASLIGKRGPDERTLLQVAASLAVGAHLRVNLRARPQLEAGPRSSVT